MCFDFKKVSLLTDEEKAVVVRTIAYDEMVKNIFVLIKNGVAPELILERLEPVNSHTNAAVIGALLDAGITPERILERFSDSDIGHLGSIIMGSLYNDKTADRLLGSIDDISDLGSLLVVLNANDKTIPKDKLLAKTESLVKGKPYRKTNRFWLYGVKRFIDAGLDANEILDLINGFDEGDLRACRTLLAEGADAERMAEIIKHCEADYLGLMLYDDLKVRGVDLDPRELLDKCSHMVNDVGSLKRMLANGLDPQLIAEMAPDSLEFRAFEILVQAGVDAKDLSSKLTFHDLYYYGPALRTLKADFNKIIEKGIAIQKTLSMEMQRYLAENSDGLMKAGVSGELLIEAIPYNIYRLTLLARSYDRLGAKLAVPLLEYITQSDGYLIELPGIFSIVISHYDDFKGASGFSHKKLKKMAKAYFDVSENPDLCEDADLIFSHLDVLLEIYPELQLSELVDEIIENNPDAIVRHIKDLLSHGVKLDLEDFLRKNGDRLGTYIDFKQTKVLIENGVSADWFLGTKLWDFEFSRKATKFFVKHVTEPNLVAYLCCHYNVISRKEELEEIIGQPTVWEKLI